MFEKATRLKVRWDSTKGPLSVEDLWDLKLEELNILAKNLNKELKTEEEDDFLNEVSEVDEVTKLKFKIVIQILETKKAEKKAREGAANRKIQKDKILDILAKKESDSLEGKSEKELKKMLEDL